MAGMLRIGLIGASGRMGRELTALIEADPGLALAGGIGREGAGELPALLAACDVAIDFSGPALTVAAAQAAANAGCPTGLRHHRARSGSDGGAAGRLDARSRVVCAEYEHGCLAAAAGPAGDRSHPCRLRHRGDRGSPPAQGRCAIGYGPDAGRGDPARVWIPRPLLSMGGRGHAPRGEGEIGFHAIRGGGNPGEHTLLFASDDEEIRVSHRTFSRAAFAAGAIRAARAVHGQPPGWYGPDD